jgi:alkanesulfonate monooxygenase SsuD/methylene tetrahydromethanopterin reductase-like flavin-dependent oxidoreductase (luciferase family)
MGDEATEVAKTTAAAGTKVAGTSCPLRVGTLADASMLRGPLARRRELLSKVRASGLDHVFVADHISFFTGFGMDGLIQAATIAALEEELEVYVGVYLLALRHPLPVARQIASLCESAPGRLVLGVGVGGEDRYEIEICGVDPRTRGRRTDASLVALRGLLSGEPTTVESEFFRFENALIHPAPDPAVPLVIGGRSAAALRRAALLGDCWLGVLPPQAFSAQNTPAADLHPAVIRDLAPPRVGQADRRGGAESGRQRGHWAISRDFRARIGGRATIASLT